jgi:hypothetical protein
MAEMLTHVGDAHQAAGEPHAARDAWQQALVILDDLNDPGAAQVRTRLSGQPAYRGAAGSPDHAAPAVT